MENQKCPQCGNEVPRNADLCVSCGARVKQPTKNSEQPMQVEKNNITFALVTGIICIFGVIVLYAYRAWLGGLIYGFGALLAIVALKKAYENDDKISAWDYIKQCFTGKDIGKKIMIVVSVLLLIVEIIATYRWIVVDTIRQVESLF